MEAIAGRKLYSIGEAYKILYKGLRTVKYLSASKKNNELNDDFAERIMLAVTEVNGCAMCSYAHTQMALEAGMSEEEVEQMLSGVTDSIPKDEVLAVMFAQHYADTRGNPSKESWERIVEVYGEPKAKGILGAIRMIMVGNTYGIVLGSFKNRFKGEPDDRSNLPYELSMLITLIVFIPVAFIQGLLANLFNIPLISFK